MYLEQGDASQGLTGFFRMGYAGKDLYQSDWSASAGLVYVGLLPGRDEDVAGVGVTVNHASSKFQSMEGASSRETQVELTYKAQVNGGFFLQPNIQYIHHPNMNQDADDVWIVGLRTELHF